MIEQSKLREYGRLARSEDHMGSWDGFKVLVEKKKNSNKTAFLSHSHKDYILARGLQKFLAEHGWEVYIDWQDKQLPSRTSSVTARKIKYKIEGLRWFLFLATDNSLNSKWCPWELGYADGFGKDDKILILRTKNDNGVVFGSEYIGLYRYLFETPYGKLIVRDRGENSAGYVELNELNGT